jgi:endonuclease/exonuclease/phosphatase family metal-dependent hydrolase
MTRLRVMTFNIFLTTLPSEEIQFFSDVWANRADFNVATIKRYNPDIIGFQEFDAGHWATYNKHLADYANYGVQEAIGTVIFWKSARFSCTDCGYFWLGDDPAQQQADWGAEDPLSAAWVLLTDRDSGEQFLLLNTHFDDGSEESRVKSSQLVLSRIEQITLEKTLPVLVLGDFNCNPWSPTYQYFLKAGFVDTFRAAGHGDSAASSTYHGFHGKTYFALEWGDQAFWRVDWILARSGLQPLQITSCTIVRDAAPPVYPSDHYPVVTEMLI